MRQAPLDEFRLRPGAQRITAFLPGRGRDDDRDRLTPIRLLIRSLGKGEERISLAPPLPLLARSPVQLHNKADALVAGGVGDVQPPIGDHPDPLLAPLGG